MVVGDRLWLFCSAASTDLATTPITQQFPNNLCNPYTTWNHHPYVRNGCTTTFPPSYGSSSSEYVEHSLINDPSYNSWLQQQHLCPSGSRTITSLSSSPQLTNWMSFLEEQTVKDHHHHHRLTFQEPLIIVGPENEEEDSSSTPSNGLAELERVFGEGNVNFLKCLNNGGNRKLENSSISGKEQNDIEDEQSRNSDIDCEHLDNDF